ncbi:hypothetical protein GC163_08160 [bacterium]|nr:hypothetical protein [bacterium]
MGRDWLQALRNRGLFQSTSRRARQRRLRTSTVPACIQVYEPRVMLSASPAGSEFRVNTVTTGSQEFFSQGGRATAMDADGDFVVTWTSQDGTGSLGIWAQRYNSSGVAQGGEFRVNSFTSGQQLYSSVAMDADGDFVVVWSSNGQDGQSYGIYGQRYNALGVAVGNEFQINSFTTGSQNLARVAMDADGDFIVTWQSDSQDGNDYGIYARRYTDQGVAIGSEFRVNTVTSQAQSQANVAAAADGAFVISWQSHLQDGSSDGIYAQRYNSQGIAEGGEFRVNTFTTQSQSNSTLAMDADGDFIVAWQSDGQDGSLYGIYAQRYDALGVAQGSEFLVNSFTTNFQYLPSVAMNAGGDFVVSWASQGQDGSGLGIYAKQYNSLGVVQGSAFRVNSFTTGTQAFPSIAMDAEGDFVVVWQSSNQDGDSYGIYAQRYAESNDVVGPFVTSIVVDGHGLSAGARLASAPDTLTVVFSEEVSVTGGTTGADSVTNPANWTLLRDGEDVSSLITGVTFGFNAATNKYEAVLTFATPLSDGEYQLTTKNPGQVQITRDARAGFTQLLSLQGTSQLTFLDARATSTVGDPSQLGGDIFVVLANSTNNDLTASVTSVAQDGNGDYTVTIELADLLGIPISTLLDIQLAIANSGGASSLISATATAAGGFGLPIALDTYGVTGAVQLLGGENTSNNDVTFTDARPLADRDSYELSVEFVAAAPNQTLSVNVTTIGMGDKLVSVMLATDALGNVTSTAAEVAALINSNSTASGELSAVAAGNGSGFVQSASATPLADLHTIRDLAGNALDGNRDGMPGGDLTTDFNTQVPVPTGAEFQINSTTTGNQGFENGPGRSVAMDASGNFVVVWTSDGQDGSNLGVFAQRFTAPGSPQGSEFRVNTFTTGAQSNHAIAMDTDGDFVVVWASLGQDGDNYGIYAQRYNSQGVAQGSEFRVNSITTGAQNLPKVAMDTDGDFVITWQSNNQDGSGYGIYAQRYNSQGVAQGSEFRVNTITTGSQRDANLAMDDNGDFVITWQSFGQDGSNYGIYAQRYNAQGIAQGSEFQVNTYTTLAQRSPTIAMDADGDFVISWSSLNQDGSSYGIYAQRYNALGMPQGTEFRVNTFTTGSQLNPSVSMNADGDFLIAWSSNGQDGSGYGVYAQRFNALGEPQGAEFLVNSFTTNAQRDVSTAMNPSGDFVMIWESTGQDGSGNGIFAQRFFANTPPMIANQSFAVDELAAVGTVVGNVIATDPDAFSTLTYSLTGGNVNKAFNINASTGQISVRRSYALDFESLATFVLRVQVTDQHGASRKANVTVDLSDVDDVPDMLPQTFSLSPHAPNNTVVGTVIATDQDTGDSLTYSITGGNVGKVFAIDATTGVIRVIKASALDPDTVPVYALTVQATDNLGANRKAVMSISLINHQPQMSPQTFTVSEDAPIYSVVGTVVASDPDAGDTLTYSITGGNVSKAFNINPTTGALFIRRAYALDFETLPVFYLTIQVKDLSGATRKAVMTINVTDANDAPIVQPQTFSVNENSPNGTVVGTVTASDQDAGSSLAYSITGGNVSSAFAIHSATGQITVNNSAALDFETTPTFNITVRVVDNTGMSRKAVMTINLNNLPDLNSGLRADEDDSLFSSMPSLLSFPV